ncbi:hypothetical protein [Spirosoma aerophilum]
MNTQQKNDVFTTIEVAIKRQQVIQIKHFNTWRTIEPYQLGIHFRGQTLVVYGYCRDVIPAHIKQSRWQVFNLEEIASIELTNYSFQTHIDYKGQYNFMQSVFAKLRPQWERLAQGYLPVRMMNYNTKKNRFMR